MKQRIATWIKGVYNFIRPVHIICVIALVVFLWMLVMGDQGLFRLGQLHELKTDLLNSRQRTSDEIDDKAHEEQLLQDPKNLEMIIRKELGYIRPGEIIYQEPEKKQ